MNDKYEVIGGIVYNTPDDDTTSSIKSALFIKAKTVADLLLISSLDRVSNIVSQLDQTTLDYMDSPLVDFIYKYANSPNHWLSFACFKGRLDVVKYLIERGANVHTNNEDALLNAVLGGHLEIVRYLIECGANIHIAKDDPLCKASEHGHLEIVRYITEKHGANIDVVYYMFAKNMASKKYHYEVIEYLQQHINRIRPKI